MVKVKVNGVAKEYGDNITYGELAAEYIKEIRGGNLG